MNVRTKNMIGAAGFVALLFGCAGYAAWAYWPPHSNIEEALKVDLTGYDAARLQKFVVDLQLNGATMDQKLKMFDKLKKHFETMPVQERMTLMKAGSKLFEDDPNNPLVANTKQVMQAYWRDQMREYITADAEKRKEMLDKQVDEQEAMENVRRMKAAADSLMGKAAEPARRDAGQIQNHIAHAMQDGMQNGSAEDRAAMQQYFTDLRQRRIDRGLAVLF